MVQVETKNGFAHPRPDVGRKDDIAPQKVEYVIDLFQIKHWIHIQDLFKSFVSTVKRLTFKYSSIKKKEKLLVCLLNLL